MHWSILQGLNVGDSSAMGGRKGGGAELCIPAPSPNPRSIRGRVCPLAPAAAPHSTALREGPGLGLNPQTPLFECASVYPDRQREPPPSSVVSGQTRGFCGASGTLLNERQGLVLWPAAPSSSR